MSKVMLLIASVRHEFLRFLQQFNPKPCTHCTHSCANTSSNTPNATADATNASTNARANAQPDTDEAHSWWMGQLDRVRHDLWRWCTHSVVQQPPA